ncbi:MAG: hypothetical protein J1F64_09995, partial [Oscillospiraceae bacterium]|nr:hypothetical protein [Oscillospiraceae bacterium]
QKNPLKNPTIGGIPNRLLNCVFPGKSGIYSKKQLTGTKNNGIIYQVNIKQAGHIRSHRIIM